MGALMKEAEQVLGTELRTYEAHKPELLARTPGHFVLIKGEEIVGTYQSQSDAISEGYRRFGHVPFLVKQIVEVEVPENFLSDRMAV